MRAWLRRIGAALRRRAALAAALSAPEPPPPPRARYEQGELIGRTFIGRDGEMKAMPIAHDARLDPRPPLLFGDHDTRRRDW